MKRLIPLIALACIALGAVGVIAFRGDGLPRAFSMTLSADLTSSGGGRTYAATLDVDGDTVAGQGSYTFSRETTTTTDCTLSNGVWSGADGACEIPLTIPTTRAELASAIADGSIVPLERCMHKQLCYELTAR